LFPRLRSLEELTGGGRNARRCRMALPCAWPLVGNSYWAANGYQSPFPSARACASTSAPFGRSASTNWVRLKQGRACRSRCAVASRASAAALMWAGSVGQAVTRRCKSGSEGGCASAVQARWVRRLKSRPASLCAGRWARNTGVGAGGEMRPRAGPRRGWHTNGCPVWLPEVRPEEFLAGGRLAALFARQRGAKRGDGGVDLPVSVSLGAGAGPWRREADGRATRTPGGKALGSRGQRPGIMEDLPTGGAGRDAGGCPGFVPVGRLRNRE
jgi:hypothetical protein